MDFYVPEDQPTIKLSPGQSMVIKLGIHIDIMDGLCMLLQSKNEQARQGLEVSTSVINSDYRGEIDVHVRNTNRDETAPIPITAGMIICQALFVPVLIVDLDQVGSLQELFPEPKNLKQLN